MHRIQIYIIICIYIHIGKHATYVHKKTTNNGINKGNETSVYTHRRILTCACAHARTHARTHTHAHTHTHIPSPSLLHTNINTLTHAPPPPPPDCCSCNNACINSQLSVTFLFSGERDDRIQRHLPVREVQGLQLHPGVRPESVLFSCQGILGVSEV